MTLDEYYNEIYLPLHKNKYNRALHFVGTLLTVTLLIAGLVTGNWILCLLAPFVVYPFAWSGHFFLEKNTPAAFSNPYYTRLSDWRMCLEIALGKI